MIPVEVEELKTYSDGDLLVGGADIAAEFFRLDMIDGLDLLIHPVVLDEGRPLFPRLEERVGFKPDPHPCVRRRCSDAPLPKGLKPFE